MHFEVLVEDISGKTALDIIIPKIIGGEHTFKVHSYKGIGHIPKGLSTRQDPSKRILLAQLPKLLSGYGNAFANYPTDYPAAVIVVCDLDNKNLNAFLNELEDILGNCANQPDTSFCIAIEEGEAWFLGDIPAVLSGYPRARQNVLNAYVNDSICGTWETLADAVFPSGSAGLSQQGWQAVGAEKSKWSKNIAPHMDVNNNKSPSFNFFKGRLLNYTET